MSEDAYFRVSVYRDASDASDTRSIMVTVHGAVVAEIRRMKSEIAALRDERTKEREEFRQTMARGRRRAR